MSGATGNGAGVWFFSRAGMAAWAALWIFSIAAIPVGATVYVDRDAPGPAHDGASWTTAFTEIQEAVDTAAAKPGGDEVWIAEGSYRAGVTMDNGVRLYGGFLGADSPTTETSLDQRDWVNNVTELSETHEEYLLQFDNATSTGVDGITFGYGGYYDCQGRGASVRIAHCRSRGNVRCLYWDNTGFPTTGTITLEDCEIMYLETAVHAANVLSLSIKDCQIQRPGDVNWGYIAVNCGVRELDVVNTVISGRSDRGLHAGANNPGSRASLRSLTVTGVAERIEDIVSLVGFQEVAVENCEFSDNLNGLSILGCGDVEISGCRFLRNQNGGLYIGPNEYGGSISPLTCSGSITDCLFQDNGWPKPGDPTSVEDCAVYAGLLFRMIDGRFVVDRCSFLHNATYVGAIAVDRCAAEIRDCFVRKSLSIGWGGTITVTSWSHPTLLKRCVIEENAVPGSMSAIQVDAASSLAIEDTRVANNDGGGIYIGYGFESGGIATVARCAVEGNGPNGLAGIHAEGAPEVLIEDTVVKGNDTQNGGVSTGSNVEEIQINRCRILENKSQTDGAGFASPFGVATVRIADSHIVGNSSRESGGGVFIKNARDVEISDSIMAGNRGGAGFGAGITLGGIQGESRISGCVVTGNQGAGAEVCPYGIVDWYSNGCRIENSIIAGQRHPDRTVGVSIWDTNPSVLANSVVLGNSGRLGTGIESNRILDVSNTIITRNSCLGAYGFGAKSGPRFASSLFFANGRGDYFNYDTATTVTGAAAINAQTNYTGALNSGNVEGDPRFVPGIRGVWAADGVYDSATSRTVLTVGSADAAFTTDSLVGRLILSNGDYEDLYVILSNSPTQLTVLGDATAFAPEGRAFEILDFHLDPSYCSPALDTGTDLNAPATDLDGAPRPVDLAGIGADGTGTAFDIGAYELQETTPTHRLVVVPESVDFGAAVIGEPAIPTTITLTNTGTAAVTFRGQGLGLAGADADQFVLAPPDLNPIAPCETRLVFVSFSPSAAGTHSATLRILTDDDLEPTILIPLTGEGIVPTPTPTETPSPTPSPTPSGPDSDHDGISDDYERAHGSDPYDPSSLPMNLDLDGNGLIDPDDALALYKTLTGQLPADPDAEYDSTDFNGDGTTNILDALLFYRSRAGSIPMIPLAD